MTTTDTTAIKQELSPTAAHVYDHIRWADGPLTVTDLMDLTGRCPRTIRECVMDLVEHDAVAVDWRWREGDAREREFFLQQ